MPLRQPRLNIGCKILLGYGAAALLTIVLATYAIFTIEHLHRVSAGIVDGDVIVADATERMIESLLAQDAFARRSLVLGAPVMSGLFEERGLELRAELDRLAALDATSRETARRLLRVHEQYTDLSRQRFDAHQAGRTAEADRLMATIEQQRDHLLAQLRATSHDARDAQIAKMSGIATVSGHAVQTMIALTLLVVIGGVLSALGIARQITRSLRRLIEATQWIARGRFDFAPEVRTHDELALVFVAFRRMGRRLKRLEEMYLDASPLTGLPGGIAIENVLRKRLHAGGPLAFCLVDLNNFKEFNDRYGYARGNELLLETAALVQRCVRRCGGPDDFVGHIGGDDFAVITTWPAHDAIGPMIIEEFDRIAPRFHNPEDRERGFVVTKNRRGEEVHFPLITIAVVAVTNQKRELKSSIQVGEIAAELKDYAKGKGQSCYAVDRRWDDTEAELESPQDAPAGSIPHA